MNISRLNNKSEQSWNEWLAGLIDGDGCFLVSKKGYTSLEITMSLKDEHALCQIKQKLGGSVKLRSKALALRYRLHDKKGMLLLIQRINGLCRNPNRLSQLERVCEKLEQPFKKPNAINQNNGWFCGFFDADGTISIRKGDYPQLTLSVSQKNPEMLELFQNNFDGRIRFDSSANCYKWDIDRKDRILNFCEYLNNYSLRSAKKRRYLLISKYFELREAFVYRSSHSENLFKAWKIFETDWDNG
uniref:Putative LAGLIDADG homing endonuclease n=1 Tax=Lobochlamys segnis TaxID=52035 RepID=A0A0S2IBS2_9CHLO|nr:putative LAGLIDADG homing endonuclease [Lobochlamys segnis]